MRSPLNSAPSLVFALVVGASGFAPVQIPSGYSLQRTSAWLSPSCSLCRSARRNQQPRRESSSVGVLSAKPRPRKGEREEDFDFDSSDSGRKACHTYTPLDDSELGSSQRHIVVISLSIHTFFVTEQCASCNLFGTLSALRAPLSSMSFTCSMSNTEPLK